MKNGLLEKALCNSPKALKKVDIPSEIRMQAFLKDAIERKDFQGQSGHAAIINHPQWQRPGHIIIAHTLPGKSLRTLPLNDLANMFRVLVRYQREWDQQIAPTKNDYSIIFNDFHSSDGQSYFYLQCIPISEEHSAPDGMYRFALNPDKEYKPVPGSPTEGQEWARLRKMVYERFNQNQPYLQKFADGHSVQNGYETVKF